MFKKLFFTTFLLISTIGVCYPSRIENTGIIDYCYSLEKILSRNSIQKRGNLLGRFKSISKEISGYGVNKTRGSLINKMINQYKTSKNSIILNLIPNKLYCLSGYWVEKVMPGTIESVMYDKSKKRINEFRELKEEVDALINNFNLEYKNIREEFNSIF